MSHKLNGYVHYYVNYSKDVRNIWCVVAVYYYHKLKRRVELKERKIFEILKNIFGLLFYIFNDNFLLAMV